MTIHYHRAIVHISPYYDADAMARAFLEAKIDLYRRSQTNMSSVGIEVAIPAVIVS